MIRRSNTGWEDGNYTLPSGHVEENETATDAVIREVREEVGIELRQDQITFMHTMVRKSGVEYIDLFFVVRDWSGEPKNAEPEKCDDVSWFPIDQLPTNTIGCIRSAIGSYRSNVPFSEYGWGPDQN